MSDACPPFAPFFGFAGVAASVSGVIELTGERIRNSFRCNPDDIEQLVHFFQIQFDFSEVFFSIIAILCLTFSGGSCFWDRKGWDWDCWSRVFPT
jgi:hypothetical protein